MKDNVNVLNKRKINFFVCYFFFYSHTILLPLIVKHMCGMLLFLYIILNVYYKKEFINYFYCNTQLNGLCCAFCQQFVVYLITSIYNNVHKVKFRQIFLVTYHIDIYICIPHNSHTKLID